HGQRLGYKCWRGHKSRWGTNRLGLACDLGQPCMVHRLVDAHAAQAGHDHALNSINTVVRQPQSRHLGPFDLSTLELRNHIGIVF
ncbi:hypothetical protein FRC12_017284, partial [Ceratobasidium sp. 428]